VIVDYDPEWPSAAARVAEAIARACAPHVRAVEHIGSTSVPGLGAKPIIDVMPVLGRFEDGHACVAPMEGIGYQYRGEYGIPGRHYFVRGDGGAGTVHAHFLVEGSPEWRNHLLFRDYLRAHPSEAAAYERVKREMAERYRDRRDLYPEAKAPFVEGVLERAATWDSSGRG
jgi:GrpB-like predicted nucleotidyltransferase (UPF0157 family)